MTIRPLPASFWDRPGQFFVPAPGEFVVPSVRFCTEVPMSYHFRWFRKIRQSEVDGTTGFSVQAAQLVRITAVVHEPVRVSLERHDKSWRVLLDPSPQASGPLRVSASAADPNSASEPNLQLALAGLHPLDFVRHTLLDTGSRFWRRIARACASRGWTFDALLDQWSLLSTESETLLWQCLEQPPEWERLAQWLGSLEKEPGDATLRKELEAVAAPREGVLSRFAASWLKARQEQSHTPLHTELGAMRAIVHHPRLSQAVRRLHQLSTRRAQRARYANRLADWLPLAERLRTLAQDCSARQVEADLSIALSGGHSLLAALIPEPLLDSSVLHSARDGDCSFLLQDGVQLTGPWAWALHQQRTVQVDLPFLEDQALPKHQRDLQTAIPFAHTPDRLVVRIVSSDRNEPFRQHGALFLGAALASRDLLPVAPQERLTFECKVMPHGGAWPRYWQRLLAAYGFSIPAPAGQDDEALLEISLPAAMLEAWSLSPHSRDPAYLDMYARLANTVQGITRRWAPFLFVQENPAVETARGILPVLAFAASSPRSLKKAASFVYDVMDKTAVLEALRSASPRILPLLKEFDPETVGGRSAIRRNPLNSRTIQSNLTLVWRYPRPFETLLALDSFLLTQCIHLAETSRQLRATHAANAPQSVRRLVREADNFGKAFGAKLSRKSPVDFTTLVPLIFMEATYALRSTGREAMIPPATFRLRQEGKVRVWRNAPQSPG